MPANLCYPKYSFMMITVAKYHTHDIRQRKQVSVQFPKDTKLNKNMHFEKHVFLKQIIVLLMSDNFYKLLLARNLWNVTHGIGFTHGQKITFLNGNMPNFSKGIENCSFICDLMFKPSVWFKNSLRLCCLHVLIIFCRIKKVFFRKLTQQRLKYYEAWCKLNSHWVYIIEASI